MSTKTFWTLYFQSEGNNLGVKLRNVVFLSGNRDIRVTRCVPGYICYQSDWTFSASELKHDNTPAEKRTDGNFSFKLDDEDFCSSFTVNFTPENCKNSSFTLSKNISSGVFKSSCFVVKLYRFRQNINTILFFLFSDPEFINLNTTKQHKPVGLPAVIKTEFPPNCKNLSVDYTCSGETTD